MASLSLTRIRFLIAVTEFLSWVNSFLFPGRWLAVSEPMKRHSTAPTNRIARFFIRKFGQVLGPYDHYRVWLDKWNLVSFSSMVIGGLWANETPLDGTDQWNRSFDSSRFLVTIETAFLMNRVLFFFVVALLLLPRFGVWTKSSDRPINGEDQLRSIRASQCGWRICVCVRLLPSGRVDFSLRHQEIFFLPCRLLPRDLSSFLSSFLLLFIRFFFVPPRSPVFPSVRRDIFTRFSLSLPPCVWGGVGHVDDDDGWNVYDCVCFFRLFSFSWCLFFCVSLFFFVCNVTARQSRSPRRRRRLFFFRLDGTVFFYVVVLRFLLLLLLSAMKFALDRVGGAGCCCCCCCCCCF